MTVNDDKCLSSDTSTCSFTAILSFHHFIHLHRFHLVQLILRGHEECSCISPFQSAILEAATGSSTKIVGTKKWKFHSSISIHLVFRCVSIRFFLVECKMQNRAPYLHLRLLCGSLSKMSIQKKVQRLSNYKREIMKTTSFPFFQITCYHGWISPALQNFEMPTLMHLDERLGSMAP